MHRSRGGRELFVGVGEDLAKAVRMMEGGRFEDVSVRLSAVMDMLVMYKEKFREGRITLPLTSEDDVYSRAQKKFFK